VATREKTLVAQLAGGDEEGVSFFDLVGIRLHHVRLPKPKNIII
jgi:hypothetical protein